MKRFIDREEEIKFLNNEYNRKGSSLVVIYGRRRVGKTALSVAFSKNKMLYIFLQRKKVNCKTEKHLKMLWQIFVEMSY